VVWRGRLTPEPPRGSFEALTAAAPPPLVIPDARQRLRDAHVRAGRRIAVLDDDPTGSQSVHGVSVVLALEPEVVAAGLSAPGDTCFLLTNSRSLSEADAVRLTATLARTVLDVGADLGAPVQFVSRGDSTLRGHVLAEPAALDAVRREVSGRGHDVTLLVPAYLEAGRLTAGDVQWAEVYEHMLPVGSTEFARDAAFGYRASNLREFLAERSGGRIRADHVVSIGLDDIRIGGPDRVAQLLCEPAAGTFVVANATEYADLEVVALGMLAAAEAGRSVLPRSGPSFVRALAGIEPQPTLTADLIYPKGYPSGHGLVVVGSHVGLSSWQVEVLRSRAGVSHIVLDVPAAVHPEHGGTYLHYLALRVARALAKTDVALSTSGIVLRGSDPEESLAIGRRVSHALSAVVRDVLVTQRPGWVLGKGGVTSHDVAVRGLGLRRATVLGQLLPGMVSVLEPAEATSAEALGLPYVVFAGNVGDGNTLADVVELLRGAPPAQPACDG